jgi:hypothetical protein
LALSTSGVVVAVAKPSTTTLHLLLVALVVSVAAALVLVAAAATLAEVQHLTLVETPQPQTVETVELTPAVAAVAL